MSYKSDMFVSEKAEYICYLTVLDGKCRMKALNPPSAVYEDKAAAKQWRDDIAEKIENDPVGMERLDHLYGIMTYEFQD